ncbi:MAG TPA: Yip1 family protein [Chloroflexia bacterium]|nr:Yip1 family protein [Chloroflexia bacterium]
MSDNYNPSSTTPSSPAPEITQAGLMDVVNSWITSLTKPAVSTYAAEVPRASQNRVIMSVGLATVVAALAGLLGGLFSGNAIGSLILALIMTPISFLLAAGGFYLGARLMKGTGSFMEHAWVWSTIWAPVSVISSILGIIPVIGGLVGLVLGLFALYLYYMAIQAVHRLDGTNAILALIIGAVILFVGMAIIGGIIAGILLAMGLAAGAAAAVTGR